MIFISVYITIVIKLDTKFPSIINEINILFMHAINYYAVKKTCKSKLICVVLEKLYFAKTLIDYD